MSLTTFLRERLLTVFYPVAVIDGTDFGRLVESLPDGRGNVGPTASSSVGLPTVRTFVFNLLRVKTGEAGSLKIEEI
jgi:hypothetical protein